MAKFRARYSGTYLGKLMYIIDRKHLGLFWWPISAELFDNAAQAKRHIDELKSFYEFR